MNTSTSQNNKSLLAIAAHLSKAAQALGAVAQSLSHSVAPTNGHRTRRAISSRPAKPVKPAKVKVAHNRVAKVKTPKTKTPQSGVPHNRIAHLLKTVKLPKEKKVSKVHRLSKEQEDDIVLLLQSSRLSVAQIATLFNVTRAAVYGVRDRRHVNARKGSKELMAGIARKRAEAAKAAKAAAQPEAAPASVPEPVGAAT